MIRIQNGNYVLSPVMFAYFTGLAMSVDPTVGNELIHTAAAHGLTPSDAHMVKNGGIENFRLTDDDGTLDNYISTAPKVNVMAEFEKQLAKALGLSPEQFAAEKKAVKAKLTSTETYEAYEETVRALVYGGCHHRF